MTNPRWTAWVSKLYTVPHTSKSKSKGRNSYMIYDILYDLDTLCGKMKKITSFWVYVVELSHYSRNPLKIYMVLEHPYSNAHLVGAKTRANSPWGSFRRLKREYTDPRCLLEEFLNIDLLYLTTMQKKKNMLKSLLIPTCLSMRAKLNMLLWNPHPIV